MYQSITIIGNIGSDPELRYTPSGVPVINFSLAANREWTSAGGEKQKKTTWFRITFWRKPAEVLGQYLKKGMPLLVVGEIEEAKVFTKRDGESSASIEVTGNTFKFMPGGRGDNEGGGYGEEEETEDDDLWGNKAEIPF